MKATTFAISILSITFANTQIVFNNLYEPYLPSVYGLHKEAKSIIQTSDGSYFVAGEPDDPSRFSAIKLSSLGELIWTFDQNIDGTVNSVIEADDGNYIVAGNSYYPYNNSRPVAFVSKLNQFTGDTIWFRKFFATDYGFEINSIKHTHDNGYVLAGSHLNFNIPGAVYVDPNILLIKIDSLGVTEWENNYGTINFEYGYSLEETSEGGFMIFGNSNDYDQVNYPYTKMCLVKTDQIGNMIWQKQFNGEFSSDEGSSICKLSDGNFAISGHVTDSLGIKGGYLAKIDNDGNILWSKKYNGFTNGEEFKQVKELPNGDLVVCGTTKLNYWATKRYGVVYRVNQIDGAEVWKRRCKFFNQTDSILAYHSLKSIGICADGGFIMAGGVCTVTQDPNYYFVTNSFWVLKTDCKGNPNQWSNQCLQIGIDELEDESSPTWFTLYPNPTTRNFSVQYTLPDNSKNNTISIYDALGKLMQIVPISDFSNAAVEIDASGFAAGVYSIVLSSDQQILQTQKLVRME